MAEELESSTAPAAYPPPVPPVAIVGMGCRFPGAGDPSAFWSLLCEGVDAISEVPKERWDVDALYDPDLSRAGTMSTRFGGFLPDVARFDAQFFGISAGEARSMDPQQRLLLEIAWEALESAAMAPERLAGSRTGVFVAVGVNDYVLRVAADLSHIGAYFTSGNALCMSVNRLSHYFDLRGPSMAVDTGCSSSLVAIHLACQSLFLGESTMAIAGGVSLMLAPHGHVALSQSWMAAADGRCKSFDEAGDGFVRGEGCGLVVLKPLSDALRDGDPILAVVRGSAVDQDGRTPTFTAPSGAAQQAVMRMALQRAGVTPREVGYIEAHGVGSPLTDGVEAHSLLAVYGADRPGSTPCMLGSVKTNIGHLEGASGIASIIKTVLMLQHGQVPPLLHQRTPLAALRQEQLLLPRSLRPWPAGEGRRIAGVNSFGLGGTNAHVVLEQAPPRSPAVEGEAWPPLVLLPLSAKSEQALRQLAARYAAEILGSGADLADVCHTAGVGRSHMAYRGAVIARSREELAERLTLLAGGRGGEGVWLGVRPAAPAPDAARLPSLPARGIAWEQRLVALAKQYTEGVEVDWAGVYRGHGRRRIAVPTYPFQGQRYWLDHGPPQSALLADAAASRGSPLQQRLASVPPGERWNALVAFVRGEVAAVLGLGSSEPLEGSLGFSEMGLTSLGIIELRNRLQLAVGSGQVLPAAVLFEQPTITGIARFLGTELLSVPTPLETVAAHRPSSPEGMLERIERMSEEEARALLLEKLGEGRP